MKLSQAKQSLEKQNDGVKVEWSGIKLKLARFGNDAAKQFTAKEARDNRERKQRGEPERSWDEYWVDMIARCILLDWEDVQKDDGTPWKYTPEDALEVLKDPHYSDLLKFIEREAATRENYLEAADSEAEKN